MNKNEIKAALKILDQERCSPPKDDPEEIESLVDWTLEHVQANEEKRQGNQATFLYNVALGRCEDLFCDPFKNPYFTILENGVKKNLQINKTEFKDYLRELYGIEKKTIPRPDIINNVAEQFAAKARNSGNVKDVYIRLAPGPDEDIYLDLANDKREVVKISKHGWSVVSNYPVIFRKGTGQLPLPYPEKGGSIDLLRQFISTDEDNFILITAFLIGAFQYGKPFPIAILKGEQGSGKTTTGRLFKKLIDPVKGQDRAFPREEEELYIMAESNHIMCFDNISGISNKSSDALCRISTGGGFSNRTLYTSRDENIFEAQRPVILNGIYDFVERSDLLDRSIIIIIERIPDEKKKSETELWKEFDRLHPLILGALLDKVVVALNNIGKVNLLEKPRMADFAQFVYAALPAPYCVRFLQIYKDNRLGSSQSILHSDLISEGLSAFMADNESWEGTSNELLVEIKTKLALDNRDYPKDFPKGGSSLTKHLQGRAPNLRDAYGICIDFPKWTTPKKGRLLKIYKTSPSPLSDQLDSSSESSEYPSCLENQGEPTSKEAISSVPNDISDIRVEHLEKLFVTPNPARAIGEVPFELSRDTYYSSIDYKKSRR